MATPGEGADVGEAVGMAETDGDGELDGDGDTDADGTADSDAAEDADNGAKLLLPEPVAEALAVEDGDALSEPEGTLEAADTDGVMLADSDAEGDTAALLLSVKLPLMVDEAVLEGVPLDDGVAL